MLKYNKSIKGLSTLNVLNDPLDNIYDVICCMGLFTCIMSDLDENLAIKKIYNHIKEGGYFFLRDLISLDNTKILNSGTYAGKYRKKEEYITFLKKNGFTWIKDGMLSNHISDGNIVSMWFIFKKQK